MLLIYIDSKLPLEPLFTGSWQTIHQSSIKSNQNGMVKLNKEINHESCIMY